MAAVARYLGATVTEFPRRAEDGFALDPGEIRKRLSPETRVIVITNLHNPTSVQAGEEALRAVGEMALEAGCKVLVDEVYREAIFDNTPRSAFHLGPQFVVTSSLTKVYGLSGLRCGWILAEPELARALWRLNDLFGVNAPHPVERLAVMALQGPGRDPGTGAAAAERQSAPASRVPGVPRGPGGGARPLGHHGFPPAAARLGRGPGRPPPQRVRDGDRSRAVLRRRAALPDRHRRRDLDGSRRAPAPGAGPG